MKVTTVQAGRVREEAPSEDAKGEEEVNVGDVADAVVFAMVQPPRMSVNQVPAPPRPPPLAALSLQS